MNNNIVRYMSIKDCPFTMDGTNLVEMRRAKLRQIAKALKVSPDGSKNDILIRVIGKLKVMGAANELRKSDG